MASIGDPDYPQTPATDPGMGEALPTYAAGLASTFRTTLNANQALLEARDLAVQASVEGIIRAHGYGAVSGGAISVGVGLSVSVAAMEALVGSAVALTAATTVGSLTPSQVNYIYLRQDGTFTVNTTGTTPSDATHGAALLWGTATTDAGAVTAVSNERAWVAPDTSTDNVAAGSALIVPAGRQWQAQGTATVYGTVTTYGTAEVLGQASTLYWDDLRVSAATLAGVGIKDPGWAKVGDNGASSQGVFCRAFDATTEEELGFEVQLPHGYKPGSDIEAHVHWQPTAAGTAGQVVRWGLEYRWANIGDTYGATTIISSGTHSPAHPALVDDVHYLTHLGTIAGANKTLSSILQCRLFRDAAGALGTDSYTSDAALISVDFHYQIEQPGSRAEYVY